jgi:GTPase SAR1 family protein
VVRSFYRGICAVYLLYAVDNATSFQELKGWLREVQQHAHEEVVLFLIGARADLAVNREVTREEAAVFLKEINGAFFIETSSKTGENVEAVLRGGCSCSSGRRRCSTKNISPTDPSATSSGQSWHRGRVCSRARSCVRTRSRS